MSISSSISQKVLQCEKKERERERKRVHSEYNIPFTKGAHVGGMSPPAMEMLWFGYFYLVYTIHGG